MNVNRINESQKRLNYYCRSSPKKRKNPNYPHSPLITLPLQPHNKSNHQHSSSSSQKHSLYSSFKLDKHQTSLRSSSNQILIEESSEEEILIDDPGAQNRVEQEDRVMVNSFGKEGVQKQNEWKKQNQLKSTNIKNNDIRIQEDQNNQQDNQNRIKIVQQLKATHHQFPQMQTHPTMSRQFTFGQEFVESQKAQIQVISIPSIQYNSRSSSGSKDILTEVRYTQSNLLYDEAEGVEKQEIGLDLDLIEATSRYHEGDDYQSPKFNLLPFQKDKEVRWITADNYKSKKDKAGGSQILIDEGTSSSKSSAVLSLSMRPYGESIYLLNQVMKDIPSELSRVYNQMHKKLIVDQIYAQQKLGKQEEQIKLLKALLFLRKNQIKCEQYLGSGVQGQDQAIQLNKILIHSLIKQIANKQIE